MSLLSLKNIAIAFPGVLALNNVSLDLEAGEIHALVGENGAGKSTLIKIIAGVWPHGSYSGQMLINGNEVTFHNVRDSENSQISVIHQELMLVNEMSVAENIFLGNEPKYRGMIDYTTMSMKAKEILEKLECSIPPDMPVSECTIGEQQMVEIAKALSKRASVFIFDEPTAALPEKDAQRLLKLIVSLKNQGLGIIYISHKLNEILDIADEVTILRNGERVSQYQRDTFDSQRIVRDMIGRSLDTVFPEIEPVREQKLLNMDRITLNHPRSPDKHILENVSISCGKGEVIGLAGLMGAGRTALLSFLFGTFRGSYNGTITFKGDRYNPVTPRDALKRDIALVTEDRKRYGLIKTADIMENMSISSLRKFCKKGLIAHDERAAECRQFIDRLAIKTPSLGFMTSNLSGGNQQKVILSRFLMTSPSLLLLDDPTRGIDVGAKYEIYRLIHTLAQEGIGIIFVSSELPEVLGLCHRTYVLQNSRVRSTFSQGEKSEEEVLALAAGV